MRGERFEKRLPRFIGKISDLHDTFVAEDKEFDRIDQFLTDFTYGLYVTSLEKTSNPDYFLRRLEKDYGLESTGTIKERITAVLIKIQGKKTTTEEVILDICAAYGCPGKYYERYREYGYVVEVYANHGADMGKMIDSLREVTPAHLRIDIHLNFVMALKAKTRYGDNHYLVRLCGENLCGDIPYIRTVGRPEKINLKARTGQYDGKNYYGYTSDGYKAGELRDKSEAGLRYLQNTNIDGKIYDFGER